MNTKFSSLVLVLALAAIACGITGPAQSVQPIPVVNEVRTATLTPTAEPSLIYTNTSAPPTETHTPIPPTGTPAPLIPVAKVIGEGAVNIRSGPCNHPILTEAMPGMEFPVTGRYRSSGGEDWWRIQIATRTGALVEGWIWGRRVEVTNVLMVPFVASQCPPFETPTSSPTPTQEILLYAFGPQYGGNGGAAFMDIPPNSARVVGLYIRSGDFVDAVKLIYDKVDLPKHGGDGGVETTIKFKRGEYITAIYGRSGVYVDSLTIETNRGRRFGPFGGSGGAPFEVRAPDGYEIVGFFGRAGAYIDAIGVVIRSR